MGKRGSDIPAAELEVLGALFRLGRGTVREVLVDLEGQGRRLAYTTVLTLLSRLEKRGTLHCDREGQAHIYRPRVSRMRVAADRVASLVKRLGGEEPVPLILELVEAQKLSAGDLRQLRQLLDRLEGEAPKRGKR